MKFCVSKVSKYFLYLERVTRLAKSIFPEALFIHLFPRGPMYLLCEDICIFPSFVVRLVEMEMENGCQIFFQWRPTVLSKVVPPGTCFY